MATTPAYRADRERRRVAAEALDARILEEHKSSGDRAEPIARRLDISTSRVYLAFKRAGILVPRGNENSSRRLSKSEVQEMDGLLRKGMSVREIAIKFGVSEKAIQQRIRNGEKLIDRVLPVINGAEVFSPYLPEGPTRQILLAVKEVLADFRDQGYIPTLRQCYYQLVARNIISNTDGAYRSLAKSLVKARRAGMIGFDDIQDRTRSIWRESRTDDDPIEAIRDLPSGVLPNYWGIQPINLEVWCEKDAIVGIVERACQKRHVSYFSGRGFASQSSLYRAGQRIERDRQNGRPTTILYLGDHDPEGLYIPEYVLEHAKEYSHGNVEVVRLGLNYEDVISYGLPPNRLKTDEETGELTSPNAYFYQKATEPYQPGGLKESWELDALRPSVIEQRIDEAIEARVDKDAWREAVEIVERDRDWLRHIRDLAIKDCNRVDWGFSGDRMNFLRYLATDREWEHSDDRQSGPPEISAFKNRRPGLDMPGVEADQDSRNFYHPDYQPE
jgi:hypothetical protein